MKGYDYSAAGAYFVPSCAHARAWRFEHPQRCALAEEAWLELPERCPGMQSDALVVLPNHIHGIIALLAPKETDQAKTDLNAIVGASKSIIAVRWLAWIGENEPHGSGRIGQRGYYERIILDALVARMDARR